jgi:oxaloacetate decarboxylase (Na+ extruding) subunit gamma
MINLTTESILSDLKGAAILIAALIIIAVIIKLAVSFFGAKKQAEGADAEKPAASPIPAGTGLKLINVDEKTAALVMAIVSHESGIPLPELVFTSIKLV